MKMLLLIASLALAMPSVAQQNPVAAAILFASEAAMQAPHGLVVSGSASATLRADTCTLRIYKGMTGGFQQASTQSDYEQTRQEIADTLRPFGLPPLKIEQQDREFSIALPLNNKGEVVFGTATASDVRKALEKLEGVSSGFIFTASNKAQATALKPLLALAVKDAKDKAKTLAALGGANTIQLTGMREQGSTSFQPSPTGWPSEGVVRAPEQTLATSVTLYFAPLAVILSTRN